MEYSTSNFIFAVMSYVVFFLGTIIWISKKKKKGEKISVFTKIVLALIYISSTITIISMIIPTPAPSSSDMSAEKTFYVKAGGAPARECPEESCKIVVTYPENTSFTFSGNSFDKDPNWTEITFPNGKPGYISKSALLSVPPPTSPIGLPPEGNGIALGKGDFDPLEIGYSYEFSFCVPESARSGATCGGLAGETGSPVGGSPPYSISKGSGFLPPGMTLELNGRLSGSPTTEGTYNFKICARDLSMNEGCQDYTMVVKKPKSAPVSPREPEPEQPKEPQKAEIKGYTGSYTINVREMTARTSSCPTCASDMSISTTVPFRVEFEQGESRATATVNAPYTSSCWRGNNPGGEFSGNMEHLVEISYSRWGGPHSKDGIYVSVMPGDYSPPDTACFYPHIVLKSALKDTDFDMRQRFDVEGGVFPLEGTYYEDYGPGEGKYGMNYDGTLEIHPIY